MAKNTWILIVVLLLGWSLTAHAQWGAVTHNPANPIFVEGFHVTHDDGSDIQEFSAFSRVFSSIGPTNSIIHGTGDWTTLIQDPSGDYYAYSARLHDVVKSPVLPGSNLIMAPIVEDDVILILAFNFTTGVPEAHAYSAQTNMWKTQALANTPVAMDVATSRFVICIKDGNNFLFGFSARKGQWMPASTTSVEPPLADGNVAGANVLDGFGVPRCFAFSGVLGNWAISPQRSGLGTLKVDHNVASMMVEAGPNNYIPCAYSAYNGLWLASPNMFPFTGSATDDLDDNVVYFADPSLPMIEAIGARPGLIWAPLPGNMSITAIYPDTIMAADANTLMAFSGVAAGAWLPEPYAGPGTSFPGTEHLVAYQDGANTIHAFSPARAAWASPFPIGVPAQPDNAVMMVETANQLFGYSARWNTWNTIAVPAAASSSALGGSIAAVQKPGGNLFIWDERRNEYVGPLNAGGPSNMFPGRNVMLFESAAEIWAYSVQRSTFETTGTVTLPTVVAPVCDDNVAMFVDSAGLLFAYASPAEEHIWFDYPNGTEYQTFSLSIPGATFIAYSILAKNPEQVLLMISPNRLLTGIPGAFAGLLWINLGGFTVFVGPNLVPPPTPPNFHSRVTLPIAPPINAQLWTQGAVHNGTMVPPVRLTSAPDPFWIF